MSSDPYVDSLKAHHAALDRAIRAEIRRPAPDALALRAMKRHKLRLKDRLHAIATGRAARQPDSAA